MKLKELGERKIIEIFTRNFDRCDNAAVGIGDDAAVFTLDSENYLVISTDLITQKTHIPREMIPLQIGRYAVNVNLSDIASMGAKPLGLVFSFGLPCDIDEKFIEELSEGINEACREHGTCVLGGDTKEHGEIIIAGTAIGRVKKDRLLTRAGAKVGDIIGVTGKIGSAAAGFHCLTRNIADSEKFIKAALEPNARVKEGEILSEYATACMDISDGLAFSLHEIAKESKKGFKVYEERIPVDEGLSRVSELSGVPVREMVFHKGGDFELLFTAPEDK
ncbi:MAG: thiamine-phosphate kinase, partial [Candidatus Hydrothermarchaeaceae archaeon]